MDPPTDYTKKRNGNKYGARKYSDKNNSPENRKPKKPRVNCLWREGDANTKIHPGSYAHEPQRQKFDISLPEVSFVEGETVKKKVAMLIGYKGTDFVGFQINEDQRTIQAELELAMYSAGMLRPDNFGMPHKYGWSTSGRTDKGVHAAAQTISCKVELKAQSITNEAEKKDEAKKEDEGNGEEKKEPSPKVLAENALEQARERMNAALPDAITVMAIERTMRNFCAKTQRDKVRYQYLLPSFMISKDAKLILNEVVIPGDTRDEKNPLTKEELTALRTRAKDIRSTPEQRQRLQTVLQRYIGTRSFHNFTKGMTHDKASATRYIMSFDVHEPVYDDATQMEWIPTTITGQSFLIHQIRKMIGAAMETARGAVSDEYIDKALTAKTHVPVPIAPATGLFLEQSWYDGYNRRKNHVKGKNANDTPDLDWSREGPVLERWKECVASIQKHIIREEYEQGNYWRYLYIQDSFFYKRYFDEEGDAAVTVVSKGSPNDEQVPASSAGDGQNLKDDAPGPEPSDGVEVTGKSALEPTVNTA